MQELAIRILSTTQQVINDTIPNLDPRDLQAMIEHHENHEAFLIIIVHDNRVSMACSVVNLHWLINKYDFDPIGIRTEFVPITSR